MNRPLLAIVLFLLAGVVVNVAVAWGCAIWSSLPPPQRMRGAESADQAWWKEHVRTGITSSEPILLSMTEAFGSEYRLLTAARDDLGINVRVELDDDGVVKAFEFTASHGSPNPWDQSLRARAGWPLLSLAGELWRAGAPFNAPIAAAHSLAPPAGAPAPVPAAVHVAAFPIQRSTAGGTQHRLAPLRPIWPGFAVNTFFYAAILWLLIFGPFALRRLIRKRRGLCPACGYDLRHGEHQACPECGVTA